jgi:RNA methyltransferase, TrmH family
MEGTIMSEIQRVTSLQNNKVSLLRSLHTHKGRLQEQSWLIEGPHLLHEALRARYRPRLVMFDHDAIAGTPIFEEVKSLTDLNVEVISTTPAIIERVSETQTPQGIVAALSISDVAPVRLQKQRQNRLRPVTLILDDVRDPGNVGTIMRSALAADVDEVYLTPHCADAFAPKVVRSASGAHFHLPLHTNQSWEQLRQIFHEHDAGIEVIIADSGAQDDYAAIDFTQPNILIIGNETHGPSQQARQVATHTVQIPMYNGVESLNAAIAASIILFESVRQRRKQA